MLFPLDGSGPESAVRRTRFLLRLSREFPTASLASASAVGIPGSAERSRVLIVAIHMGGSIGYDSPHRDEVVYASRPAVRQENELLDGMQRRLGPPALTNAGGSIRLWRGRCFSIRRRLFSRLVFPRAPTTRHPVFRRSIDLGMAPVGIWRAVGKVYGRPTGGSGARSAEPAGRGAGAHTSRRPRARRGFCDTKY